MKPTYLDLKAININLQDKNREDILYNLGIKHGIHDHDHQNINMFLSENEFGKLYITGYKVGIEEASKKKWYVVSLSNADHEISGWYIQVGDTNDWVKEKEEATAFPTKSAVDKIQENLTSTFGRIRYSIYWG